MDLTVKDVAELLNVSETTIHRWATAGDIPAYLLDGRYRFSRSEIQDWIFQCKQESGHYAVQKEESLSKAGMQQFSLYRAVNKGGVFSDIPGTDKQAVIQNTVERIAKDLDVDPVIMTNLLLDREELMATALNHGISVPHTRDSLLDAYHDVVTIVFPKNPIDYGALDGQPVHTMFFLFACDDRRHLNLLSKIAHLSSDPKILAFLQSKPDKESFLQCVKQWEGSL